MKGNNRVQRFMVLGSARTGSNLLLSLLSTHPAIKMYSELFNLDTLPESDLREVLDDPVAYLQRRLARAERPGIATVGFKMFYDHLTPDYFRKPVALAEMSEGMRRKFTAFETFIDAHYHRPVLYERFRRAWENLVADRSFAVIHLRRRNALHTLISLKTAFKTRRWWSLKGKVQETTVLDLDPGECQRYFEWMDTLAARADADFAGHARLDLAYEDLVEHRDQAVRRVFAFLRVAQEPVSTRMQKQIVAPPAEIVRNYHQLKASFARTRWHIFFE